MERHRRIADSRTAPLLPSHELSRELFAVDLRIGLCQRLRQLSQGFGLRPCADLDARLGPQNLGEFHFPSLLGPVTAEFLGEITTACTVRCPVNCTAGSRRLPSQRRRPPALERPPPPRPDLIPPVLRLEP